MLSSLASVIGGAGQKALVDQGGSLLASLLGGKSQSALSSALGQSPASAKAARRPARTSRPRRARRARATAAPGRSRRTGPRQPVDLAKANVADALPAGFAKYLGGTGLLDDVAGAVAKRAPEPAAAPSSSSWVGCSARSRWPRSAFCAGGCCRASPNQVSRQRPRRSKPRGEPERVRQAERREGVAMWMSASSPRPPSVASRLRLQASRTKRRLRLPCPSSIRPSSGSSSSTACCPAPTRGASGARRSDRRHQADPRSVDGQSARNSGRWRDHPARGRRHPLRAQHACHGDLGLSGAGEKNGDVRKARASPSPYLKPL